MRLPTITCFFLLTLSSQGAQLASESVQRALKTLCNASDESHQAELSRVRLAAKEVSDFGEQRALASFIIYESTLKEKTSLSLPHLGKEKSAKWWQLLKEELVSLLKSEDKFSPRLAGNIFRNLRSSTVEGLDEVCNFFALRAVLWDYYRREANSNAAEWYNDNLTEKEKDGVERCFDKMGYEEDYYDDSSADDDDSEFDLEDDQSEPSQPKKKVKFAGASITVRPCDGVHKEAEIDETTCTVAEATDFAAKATDFAAGVGNRGGEVNYFAYTSDFDDGDLFPDFSNPFAGEIE